MPAAPSCSPHAEPDNVAIDDSAIISPRPYALPVSQSSLQLLSIQQLCRHMESASAEAHTSRQLSLAEECILMWDRVSIALMMADLSVRMCSAVSGGVLRLNHRTCDHTPWMQSDAGCAEGAHQMATWRLLQATQLADCRSFVQSIFLCPSLGPAPLYQERQPWVHTSLCLICTRQPT